MVNKVGNSAWQRRGISLIWKPEALVEVSPTGDTRSLREFYHIKNSWPDDLPHSNGNALVVSGLEGVLDLLPSEEIDVWLQDDFRPAILSFQSHYEGQCGLLFWLPSARSRIECNRAQERYYWKRRHPSYGDPIHLGRLIYAGAETELDRIVISEKPDADPDGDGWAGLYHPRIS